MPRDDDLMRRLRPFETWYGRDEAPSTPRLLRAGPVTVQLVGGDLRYVQAGGTEIVRRIYVAVRDHNWVTIPGEISAAKLDTGARYFQFCFDARHRRRPVDFVWQGRIHGNPDGTITYSMTGKAVSPFRYNRIGFCILHPPQTSAGRPYCGLSQAGPIRGALPSLIGRQRFENGTFIPLFPAVKELALDLAQGALVRFKFQGDWFEMEDQRNWTDHSFKTYCTPLALPFPRAARRGQRIEQQISLVLEKKPRRRSSPTQSLSLSVGSGLGRNLPELGLGLANHDSPLSARELGLLRRLRLAHLRVDLHLRNPQEASRRLLEAASAAQHLDCRLEVALFLGDPAVTQLARLQGWIQTGGSIARFLVFHEAEACTAPKWVRLARQRLQASAPAAEFVGGTNAYFAELNRTRPEMSGLDGLVYSLNPQVHAFDEQSMAETLEAQAVTVRTARAFAHGRRVHVSPVTLRPRFNANATGPGSRRGRGDLPAAVDARQMSLFGAGWTLGSTKYLAEAGADSVTYFETTGWQGVVELEQGAPLPDRFPSRPGQLFPLYHVLADIARWQTAELVRCASSDPLRLIGLAFRQAKAQHFLAANLTSEPLSVTLEVRGVHSLSARTLDARNARAAMRDPDFFARSAERLLPRAGTVVMELAPYALSVLDAPAH